LLTIEKFVPNLENLKNQLAIVMETDKEWFVTLWKNLKRSCEYKILIN
jgi:hypothetical protein